MRLYVEAGDRSSTNVLEQTGLNLSNGGIFSCHVNAALLQSVGCTGEYRSTTYTRSTLFTLTPGWTPLEMVLSVILRVSMHASIIQ